jgi:HAD superfamily hydrolase (TIGR01509 family)
LSIDGSSARLGIRSIHGGAETDLLRAFLFDFDGTIADTEPMHFRAFAGVLAKRGIVLDKEAYDARYLALTDRACIEQAAREFHRPDLRADLEALFGEKVEAMDRLLRGPVALCAGVEAFLEKAAGVGPLAVVTGAVRHEVEGILAHTGLGRFFAAVVADEDIKNGKPDPEGYLAGLQRLRSLLPDLEPRECLVVEDAPGGIVAGQRAGMRTLALAHSLPMERLSGADLVAASYADVDWDAISRLDR